MKPFLFILEIVIAALVFTWLLWLAR